MRALRLAITGPRNLPPAARAALAGTLRATLRALAPPGLLLSPLAEGADQLAAEVALAEGWRLHAVLPFAQPDYERDFATPATPGTTAEDCLAGFRRLLAAADQVTTLPNPREPAPSLGYEAAGRAVVEGAALLIGIWDGVETGKRGGTSETIRHAVARGVPVWWLRADGLGGPRVIADAGGFAARGDLPEGAAAWDWLSAWRRGR